MRAAGQSNLELSDGRETLLAPFSQASTVEPGSAPAMETDEAEVEP